MVKDTLSESGKLFLLAALLAKDRLISNNGKVFLKELIMRKDKSLTSLLSKFESKESMDSSFLEEVHNLILEESQKSYDQLFYDTSLEVGKSLSKKDRENQNLTHDKSLIYGEVDYVSFYRVLRKINPSPGSVFYDLGSGTSKAVFAALFTQDFGRCVGVEVLPALHHRAQTLVDRYKSSFKDLLMVGQAHEAAVYLGSFLEFDWTDGDVVFANSTCFDDALMTQMATCAERLRPGSVFVSFTKSLPSRCFEIIERRRYRMSWGPATVFIQRRLTDDGSILPPFRLNALPSDDIEYSEPEPEPLPESESSSAGPSSTKRDGRTPGGTVGGKLRKKIPKVPRLTVSSPAGTKPTEKVSGSRVRANSPLDSALLYRKRSPRSM